MWPEGILLSVLSGALLTAGFPKLEMHYLAWIALVPLLMAVRGKSSREAFTLGYICGMVHCATTFYWIRYVIYYYGGLSLPLALTVLFILCAYLGVYPALFALTAQKWEKRPYLMAFGLPAAWVTLEWVKAHAITGFPWANLGYTQTPFFRLIQIADITGVYGVSWLVALGSTAVAACVMKPRLRSPLAVFGVLMVCAVSYGSWRLEVIRGLQEQAKPWTVAVAQGNVDQSKKWDPAFQQETLSRYRELSLKAVKGSLRPDLVVWPETAAPFLYGVDEKLTAQLNDMIAEIGTPVLFGSPAVTSVGGKARLLNRAYLVDMANHQVSAYAKQHLVPFGEYVPYQKVLFFVSRLVQAAGDFAAGNDSSPLRLDGQSLGVLVCYEGIFPDLSRKTVKRGATALINITNDAWYGRTSAPYQHLEMARWRAVEFRVPMIRAANTGVSAIFDATGAECGSIPLGEMDSMVQTVRPFRTLTIYARLGDYFPWLCVLIAAGGMAYAFLRRRAE